MYNTFYAVYDFNSTLGREARIVFRPVGMGFPPVNLSFGIMAYLDGLPEETEGLVVYLELDESELDPKDVGQIALERSTYLIRINPSRTHTIESGTKILPWPPPNNTFIIWHKQALLLLIQT